MLLGAEQPAGEEDEHHQQQGAEDGPLDAVGDGVAGKERRHVGDDGDGDPAGHGLGLLEFTVGEHPLAEHGEDGNPGKGLGDPAQGAGVDVPHQGVVIRGVDVGPVEDPDDDGEHEHDQGPEERDTGHRPGLTIHGLPLRLA